MDTIDITIDPQRAAFEKAFPDKPYLVDAHFSKGRRAIPLFCGKGRNKDGDLVAWVAVIATMSSIIQFVEYDEFRSKWAPAGGAVIALPEQVVKVKGKPGRKPTVKPEPILQEKTVAVFTGTDGKPFTGKVGDRVFKKGVEVFTEKPVETASPVVEPEYDESSPDAPSDPDAPAEDINIE